MSKRTILGLLVACLCLAALIAYFRQRNYSRYNTGEVTTMDGRGGPPVPTPVAETPPVNKKEPAGHPMDEPEATVLPSTSSPDSQTAPASTPAPVSTGDSTVAGAGRFQVYRQGDLTWRVDTENGSTCVLFATDEEWRKPRVYRRACERE